MNRREILLAALNCYSSALDDNMMSMAGFDGDPADLVWLRSQVNGLREELSTSPREVNQAFRSNPGDAIRPPTPPYPAQNDPVLSDILSDALVTLRDMPPRNDHDMLLVLLAVSVRSHVEGYCLALEGPRP